MAKKLLYKSRVVAIVSYYEHFLLPYTKLSSNTVELSITLERRNVLKTGEKYNITI